MATAGRGGSLSAYDMNLILLFLVVGWWGAAGVDSVPLRVIFTGEVVGRYDKVKDDSGYAFGGLAHLAAVVRSEQAKAQASNSPTLTLDLGSMKAVGLLDTIGKGKIGVDYMNIMGYNAAGVGQNEFLLGLPGLIEGYNRKQFDAIVSSLEFDTSVAADAWNTFSRYSVVNAIVPGNAVGSSPTVKVGILAFIDEAMCEITACFVNGTFSVQPQPVEDSINKQIEIMKSSHPDVSCVIVIETGILETNSLDQERIVKLNADIVLFPYESSGNVNGTSPFFGVQTKPHPMILTKPENRGQIIVGAIPNGVGVGVLDISVNTATKTSGVVTGGASAFIPALHCDSNGLPTGCVQPDTTVQTNVTQHDEAVQSIVSQVVGLNEVLMRGDSEACRFFPCGTGMLGGDAVRESAKAFNSPCDFAIVNGGAIRANISAGNVTLNNVFKTFPFNNAIKVLSLTGQTIIEMLENSISKLPSDLNSASIDQAIKGGGSGRYLQLSGAHVYYDLSQKIGKRVHTVYVESSEIKGPRGYRKVETNLTYTMCSSTFLPTGVTSMYLVQLLQNQYSLNLPYRMLLSII